MMKADAFLAHLAQIRDQPQALYVITGDEPLLVMETLDALRKKLQAGGYTEREVLMHEKGFDWAQLMNAGQTMSLFGDKRFVELRIPTGKPGRDGAEAIKQFCTHLNHQTEVDTVTCIVLPQLDGQSYKSAWFTALDETGVVVRIEPIARHLLPQWIEARLKQQGQLMEKSEAGQRALQFMADQVEGNLIAAHQEIQKLSLLYPEGQLTLDQVQDSILNVARYDVFQLTEALLSGDLQRYNRMLEGLEGEGEALVLVLWTVTEEVRLLNRLRQASDAGGHLQSLMKQNRVWGMREKLIPQALGRLSTDRLQKAQSLLGGLDRQAKGLVIRQGEDALLEKLPSNPWEGLRMLGRLFI